ISVPTKIRDDDDTSDTSSDSDDEYESESDSESGGDTTAHSTAVSIKRKWVTEEQATPASITSFGEVSQADDFKESPIELQPVQSDPKVLPLLEPTPWDWSLADLPAPTMYADLEPLFKLVPSPGKMEPPPTRI